MPLEAFDEPARFASRAEMEDEVLRWSANHGMGDPAGTPERISA